MSDTLTSAPKDTLKSFKVVWKKLALDQKISLSAMFFLLITLPVAILLSISPIKFLTGRASTPVTPPITPSTTTTPTPIPNFGKAILLDGSTSYVLVGNSANINPELGMTLETWVKPSSITFPSKYIFSKDLTDNDFHLLMSSYQNPDGSYDLGYQLSVPDSNNNCLSPYFVYNETISYQNRLQIMSWRHVALVIQPDGFINLFINGYKTPVPLNANIAAGCTGESSLIIGGSSGGFALFNAAFDEFRVSNIARYNASFTPILRPFANDLNNEVLYHFDDNITDFSGKSHDGLAKGNATYIDSYIAFPTPTFTPTPTYVQPSPTRVPTFTPTPTTAVSTPTVVPTISIFPSTPTPTSAPPENNVAPRITTSRFKSGSVGSYLERKIEAIDRNGDRLTMSASNLPLGLTFGDCNFEVRENRTSRLTCYVKGSPTQAGIFATRFTAKDEWMTETSKTIYFTIFP